MNYNVVSSDVFRVVFSSVFMLVYTVQTCESLILTSAVSIFLRFSIYTSCHLQKIILFFF